jgi:DNA mismatch endonuclease (patch repair protein)
MDINIGGFRTLDKSGLKDRILRMRRPYEQPTREVSERMKKVKGRGTRLEAAMEEILQGLGIEYETQVELLRARPDFRIKGTNVLIFCDSSFWHGKRKSETSGEAFGRNREFWTEKLNANKRRDRRINQRLRRAGWSVHRFLDVDVLKKPEKVARRLRRIVDGHSE